MLFVLLALALAASFYFGRKFAYHEIDSDEFAKEYNDTIEALGYRVLCPMHCDKCVKNAREYLKGADENQ